MPMTFGELVKSQMELDPSSDVVTAAAYEIPFGKHKGMTLSLLMEQQHSYCMWLINQEESKNPNFNETCENIKILLAADQVAIDEAVKIDGVEIVEGEPVLQVDPDFVNPKLIETSNGIYEASTEPTKLPVGLLMGKVSELLEKIDAEGLIFYFDHEEEKRWVTLVKEFQHGTDSFVVIETKIGLGCPQRIKRMIPLKELKKRKGVIQNA